MKYIFIFLIINISAFAFAQQVGSKVSFTATDGKTYTGVIKEIQADKYKIKYDGFDFESWLTASQFTVTDNTTQTNNDQPAWPQTGTEPAPQTMPQTTTEITPQTIPQNNVQGMGTETSGQKTMTSLDSLKLALNNMKSAVGAFTKLFSFKRDTLAIIVPEIDFENNSLAQLRDNLKKIKGVKSVTMQYKSGTAIIEVAYKGKSSEVWNGCPMM